MASNATFLQTGAMGGFVVATIHSLQTAFRANEAMIVVVPQVFVTLLVCVLTGAGIGLILSLLIQAGQD